MTKSEFKGVFPTSERYTFVEIRFSTINFLAKFFIKMHSLRLYEDIVTCAVCLAQVKREFNDSNTKENLGGKYQGNKSNIHIKFYVQNKAI